MPHLKKIILASTSPRRKELFSKAKIPFEIQGSDYEEDMTLDMSPPELVEYLSAGKAKAVAEKNKDAIVIAADTFVVLEGRKIGKPKDEAEARAMLGLLSGKEHEIITGVTIIDSGSGKSRSFHETTRIFFEELSPEDIDGYIRTGEPMDKAAAYALQEIGCLFIRKVEGDALSAVGLPLKRVLKELKEFGVSAL